MVEAWQVDGLCMFKRFFGGGDGKGSDGGSDGPRRPPKDLASDSRVRVFEKAKHVALHKYGRILKVTPYKVEEGITLQDCLLVAYYSHAIEMMVAAGVRDIEDLTGRDRAVIGCMALAFDLDDAGFKAICRKLTPEQVEKAQTFRQKWLDAERMEPKMEAIRQRQREARGQATQDRIAKARAVQALHQGHTLAEAYDIGCRQLQSGALLGGVGAPLYFLLPYGVQRCRAPYSPTVPDWADLPPFQRLTAREREISAHLHKLLAHLSDADVEMDMITARPQVGTETSWFVTLAAAFSGHPMPPGRLPFGRGRSPHWPEGANLPDSFLSLFDTVTALHLNWDRPPEPLDMKDGH